MAENLVIRLDPDAATASWLVFDPATGRAHTIGSGSLESCAQHAAQRRVVVLVPGEDVLLGRVRLPVRGKARMLQAVPFAMEEQLAEDVGNLHFALGPRDEDGNVAVAVARRAAMAAWLDRLTEAGLRPAVLLPDTAGLPIHDGATLVLDGDRVWLRQPDGSALVCDAEMCTENLRAIGLEPEAQEAPAHIYVSNDDRERRSQLLTELSLIFPESELAVLPQGALGILAPTALATVGTGLLQGEYAPSGGREKLWQPWRAAAVLAGVLVVLGLGVKAAEVITLKSEARTLTADINEIAGKALQGSRIVNPMVQLEQRAAELRGSGEPADSPFLDTLEALGSVLANAGGTTLRKLDYRNGVMDLTLEAPDVDTLDRIRQGMSAREGIAAEIQSANQRDDAVVGRIRLQRSG